MQASLDFEDLKAFKKKELAQHPITEETSPNEADNTGNFDYSTDSKL